MHAKWLRMSVLFSAVAGLLLAMADVSEAGRRRCRRQSRGGCGGYSSCGQANYGYSSGCNTQHYQQQHYQNGEHGEVYGEPAPQPPRMDGGRDTGPGSPPPSPSDAN